MKLFPHYTQLDAMDCGATCLRMVAKYYGRDNAIKIRLYILCFFCKIFYHMNFLLYLCIN